MKSLSAVILAAGKGTRMGSDLPKCAHRVAARPMVRWVADACAEAGCTRVIIVVGHGREIVKSALEGFQADHPGVALDFALQAEQHGTGHAVACAAHLFTNEIRTGGHDVFVLAGDGPLIRAETLKTLVDRHEADRASATLATSTIKDPAGYGRIVRDESGDFLDIVEHKNATQQQLEICEINPSYYCFDVKALFDTLDQLTPDEGTGERFITDVPKLLMQQGKAVSVVDAVPAEDVLSINTPDQLAQVERVLEQRLARTGKVNAR
ncbi:MAG: NTP transferase domain-containing protein [Phycisphaerales bacterium]|nr:NTP transferase domain-containing protein [Phycisphaerales bacterium]